MTPVCGEGFGLAMTMEQTAAEAKAQAERAMGPILGAIYSVTLYQFFEPISNRDDRHDEGP